MRWSISYYGRQQEGIELAFRVIAISRDLAALVDPSRSGCCPARGSDIDHGFVTKKKGLTAVSLV